MIDPNTNPWSAELPIIPQFQLTSFDCGPACAQMLLSLVGFPPSTLPDQECLLDEINDHGQANLQNGDPYGLAFTLNDWAETSLAKPFGVFRAADAQSAIAPVVRGLLDDGLAAAVNVYNGRHWIAVFGGTGDSNTITGTPDVDKLWMFDPNAGYARTIVDGTPAFTDVNNPVGENITFDAFTDTYFTAAPYTDKLSYVAVCSSNALKGSSTPPPPPDAPPSTDDLPDPGAPGDSAALSPTLLQRAAAPAGLRMTLANSCEQVPLRSGAIVAPVNSEARVVAAARVAIAAAGLSEFFAGTTSRRPRLASRLGGGAAYNLVPFERPDGRANVVRLGANLRYLGAAFGVPTADLYDDERAAKLASALLERAGYRVDFGVRTERRLVWHPSYESTSPYDPFYLFHAGGHTVLVSLEGKAYFGLHELKTRVPIRIAERGER